MTNAEVQNTYTKLINKELQKYTHPYFTQPPNIFEAKAAKFTEWLFLDNDRWRNECRKVNGPTIKQLFTLAEESIKKLCYFHREIKNTHTEYMERMQNLDNELKEAEFYPEASFFVGEDAYCSPNI